MNTRHRHVASQANHDGFEPVQGKESERQSAKCTAVVVVAACILNTPEAFERIGKSIRLIAHIEQQSVH